MLCGLETAGSWLKLLANPSMQTHLRVWNSIGMIYLLDCRMLRFCDVGIVFGFLNAYASRKILRRNVDALDSGVNRLLRLPWCRPAWLVTTSIVDVGSSLPTYLLICDYFFLEIIVIVKSCLNVHEIILSTDELVVQIGANQ